MSGRTIRGWEEPGLAPRIASSIEDSCIGDNDAESDPVILRFFFGNDIKFPGIYSGLEPRGVFPKRLTLMIRMIIPMMKAITPATVHAGDTPAISSQFATHAMGRRWRIPAPCRDHNRPRNAIKAPVPPPAICFAFIIQSPDLAVSRCLMSHVR